MDIVDELRRSVWHEFVPTEKAADEIERLRRFERAANVLVEECRTLTGTLWPQNQTTKMLARVLDEFDRAALEEK